MRATKTSSVSTVEFNPAHLELDAVYRIERLDNTSLIALQVTLTYMMTRRYRHLKKKLTQVVIQNSNLLLKYRPQDQSNISPTRSQREFHVVLIVLEAFSRRPGPLFRPLLEIDRNKIKINNFLHVS